MEISNNLGLYSNSVHTNNIDNMKAYFIEGSPLHAASFQIVFAFCSD